MTDWKVVDQIGSLPVDASVEGQGWVVCGNDSYRTKDMTLMRKPDKLSFSTWAESAGTNEDNCFWHVYPEDYVDSWTFFETKCPYPHLFISKYIEAPGFEKAIEVYNPTGRKVNLAHFSLRVTQRGTGW